MYDGLISHKYELVLTSDSDFPYTARCTVDYLDGKIVFLECDLPDSGTV